MTLHDQIVESGRHNYDGLRIPLQSKLNIHWLRQELLNYHDVGVIDGLEFGWPIGFTGEIPRNQEPKNHKGAREFPKQVTEYIRKEKGKGAILGPFQHNPFNCDHVLSPINTVPKRDSDDRRVILDLSFPEGSSVNDGIAKESYLGVPLKVSYPSVDDLTAIVKQKGVGCHLFKRDLSRAYRQLPVCPGDIHLLGYKWAGQLFYDRVLAMGLRSAAQMCQRVTSAIGFIFKKRGFDVINYLDDFGGAETPGKANEAFEVLGSIIQSAGLEESQQKAVPPSTSMIFLGILFKTETMTLEIDQERVDEILDLIREWLTRNSAKRKEVESLLGKLHFVAGCVRPGRVFVARLLNFLRGMPADREIRIDPEIIKDLEWWEKYLPIYNGVSMMPVANWGRPDEVLATDACLVGCGGLAEGDFFHASFPEFIRAQQLHINALELLTIVVALKLWSSRFTGKRILVYCDDAASVQVLNTGSSRDSFSQACLREVSFRAACFEFELKAVHLPGTLNRLPDLLSRWDLNPRFQTEFLALANGSWEECVIEDSLFNFDNFW